MPASPQSPPWPRIKEIAFEALDQEAAQRRAFLDSACDGDTALRAEVEKLIRAHEAAEDGGFLDPPSIPDPSTGPVARPINDPATLVGLRVGRYKVRRLIGTGGMGAVYEAVQEQPRRTVALKVMRAGLASRSALRRFEYEAQLLARLRHPGIAQVFEAGAHEGPHGTVPYFAMEYIPGAKPISEHARALPLPGKLSLFAAVCEAVQHGHTKGIVHRDLKPSNILVDSSGAPKIIDFGVARATDSDLAITTLQTDVGQLIGTLQYMSPEQCAADPNDIDTRSDVYSLGVVLYELLTGRPPYDLAGVPIYEAPRIVREQAPTRPSGINPALRGDLQIIALKALEKDRAHRYQSAQELALDLRRSLAGDAISARPPSVIYQLLIFTRRHRPLVIGIAAVAAALILGVLVSLVGFSRAIDARDLARAAADDAKAQAARAAKIADFLKATLGSADPSLAIMAGVARGPGGQDDLSPWERVWRGPWEYAGQPGRLPTAADLLLAAARKLDQTFPEDPSIQAELGALVGRTLVGYGAVTEAIDLLDRALRIQRQIMGLKNEETLATMIALAACHGLQSRWDLAESLLKEAQDAASKTFGRTDARTLEIGRQRTQNLIQTPEHRADAITLQQETVAMLDHLLGPEDPQTLTETGHLASLLEACGRWDESETQARRAVDGLRKVLGSFRRATVDATATLAHILRTKCGGAAAAGGEAATSSRGWLEEAESLQRGVVAFYESTMGRDFGGTNEHRKAEVEMLVLLGRFDQAEPIARAIVESELRVYGPDSLFAVKAQARLARVMAAGGIRLDEAETIARKAAERTWRLTSEHEDYAVYHKATLAAVLRARGRAEDARASAIILLKHGKDPQSRNSAWVNAFVGSVLGECQTDLGAYDDALATLTAALADADDWGDPSSAIRIGVIRALVRLHEARGHASDAAAWRKKLPSLAESGGPAPR